MMQNCWCGLLWLTLTAPLAAAPPPPQPTLVVFADAADDATGWPGSVLRVGQGAAAGFAPYAPEQAAGVALLGPGGSIPVHAERAFGGRGNALRIAVQSADAGWWSAELPVRLAAVPSAAGLAEGQLVIAVRGTTGSETVDIGLIDSATPRHSVRFPLTRYGPIATSWTVYRIPLSHFLSLAPELRLDRLAAVQLFSGRPQPMLLDMDQVGFELGSAGGPLRSVEPAPPVVPAPTAPRAPAVVRPEAPSTAPTTPHTAEPAPTVAPPAAPAGPTVDPGTAAPAAPLPTPTAPHGSAATPAPPVNVVPTPPEPQAPTPTVPHSSQPPIIAPTPQPEPPALTPVAPTPAAPHAPEPTPATPPAGTITLPPPPPPMRPVAVFFSGDDLTGTSLADSTLSANWATNQGERGFQPDELRELFAVADGDRLPLVTADHPGHVGRVIQLKAKEAGFAWWSVRLTAPGGALDLRPYAKNGFLELAVRGATGGELFRVGLADGKTPPAVALVTPSASEGVVGTEWGLIRIRLRKLTDVNNKLDLSKIVALQLGSANGAPLDVQLDDIRIVMPPKEHD